MDVSYAGIFAALQSGLGKRTVALEFVAAPENNVQRVFDLAKSCDLRFVKPSLDVLSALAKHATEAPEIAESLAKVAPSVLRMLKDQGIGALRQANQVLLALYVFWTGDK